MKRLAWFMFALLLLGCGSKAPSEVVGTWKAEIPKEYQEQAQKMNMPDTFLEMKSNGTFELKTALMGGISQTGDYTVDGNAVTLNVTKDGDKAKTDKIDGQLSADKKTMTLRGITLRKQ